MEETKWYGESGKLELELEPNHHFSTLDLQAWPWFLTQPWPFQVLTTRGRSTENLALKITILITWRNNRVIFFCSSNKAEHNVGDIASFCELVDSVGALLDTVGGRRGTFERFLAAQHMLATAHASQPEHTSANVLGHPLHLMELCG